MDPSAFFTRHHCFYEGWFFMGRFVVVVHGPAAMKACPVMPVRVPTYGSDPFWTVVTRPCRNCSAQNSSAPSDCIADFFGRVHGGCTRPVLLQNCMVESPPLFSVKRRSFHVQPNQSFRAEDQEGRKNDKRLSLAACCASWKKEGLCRHPAFDF